MRCIHPQRSSVETLHMQELFGNFDEDIRRVGMDQVREDQQTSAARQRIPRNCFVAGDSQSDKDIKTTSHIPLHTGGGRSSKKAQTFGLDHTR